jgi:hypothetical protein
VSRSRIRRPVCRPFSAVCNSPLSYSVRSTTAAVAAFVFPDSMPPQVDVETRTSGRRNKNGCGLLVTIATASRHHRTVAIGPDSKGSFKRFRGGEWAMFSSTDEVWPP